MCDNWEIKQNNICNVHDFLIVLFNDFKGCLNSNTIIKMISLSPGVAIRLVEYIYIYIYIYSLQLFVEQHKPSVPACGSLPVRLFSLVRVKCLEKLGPKTSRRRCLAGSICG